MFLLDEVREQDEGQRWNPTFQMMHLDTRQLVEDKTTKTAKAPQNRSLNRYRDVLPYDDTRVELKTGNNDYINANFVEVPEVKRKYILAQGPLQNTCGNFWRMIWENECSGIIMLCRIVEKQMVKCHPYWPMGEDEVVEFDSFKIKNIRAVMEQHYIERELLITHIPSGEKRSMKQFHFMTWPDFGVPEDAASFVEFLDVLRNNNMFGNDKPPVVHCSAGIGRSGTLILVDAALKLCEENDTPDGLDVRDMLLSLRTYRCGLVQTAQQYRFAYIAILTGLNTMFPKLFEGAIEAEDSVDEDAGPPTLPQKATKSSVPPKKPPRASSHSEAQQDDIKKFKILNELESSGESDDEEEEVLDLSDPELDTTLDTVNQPLRNQEETKEDYESEDDAADEDDENTNDSEEDVEVKETHSQIQQESNETLETSQPSSDSIGTKARENELRHRQRQEKKEATNDLINNIKQKMKDSEKQTPFPNKTLWYVGIAAVVTSCVVLAYKWWS